MEQPTTTEETETMSTTTAREGSIIVDIDGNERGRVTDTGCGGQIVWVTTDGGETTAMEVTEDGVFDADADESFVVAR